jgi:dihydrofolate reductase
MHTSSKLIVAEFTSLDGVIGDPDGTWEEPGGGWAWRQGPDVFAGDRFDLAPVLANGSLLLGRSTWQAFAQRWPDRTGVFADAINGARKHVASSTLRDVTAWPGSTLLTGDLPTAVARLRADGDVAVIGSAALAASLAAAGLVDEYRLLVLPTVVGCGRRLFTSDRTADLRLVSAEVVGTGVLLRHELVDRPSARATVTVPR